MLLASGLMEGGRAAAKARLERFWKRMSRAAALTPSAALAGLSLGLMTRALSPYLFNPFNLNPLREALSDEVDFARLRTRSPVRLLIGATRVGDGALRVFSTGEVSVDVVLASACLPLIHHAIEIDGEPYWDGGYSANPPLIPLARASNAAHLLIVQVTPTNAARLPTSPREIAKRLEQIHFNATLNAELEALKYGMLRRRDAEAAPPAHRPHLRAGGIRRPRRRERRQSRLGIPRTPARQRPQRGRDLARRNATGERTRAVGAGDRRAMSAGRVAQAAQPTPSRSARGVTFRRAGGLLDFFASQASRAPARSSARRNSGGRRRRVTD